MPHGPINQHDDFPGNWTSWYKASWTPGWIPYITSSSYGAAVSAYRRPASTSNPIGPTGRPDAGWKASGGYSVSREVTVELQDRPGYVQYRYAGEIGAPVNASSNIGVIPAVSSSLAADTMRECLAQFTERAVQLGAAAREAGSTFKMVGDAATGMAHGLDNLMSKDWKSLGRMASWRKLPSAYLEYLYGWRPVSEDISNAFDQLDNSLQEDGCTFSLRRTKKLESITPPVRRDLFDGRIPAEIIWRHRQQCRAVMRFALPSWYWEELPTVAPFGTLYETTRASFIVDWFIPIGSWIGAFESAQLWPFFTGGTMSEKRERTVQSFRVINPENKFRLTQGPIRNNHYDYSYERSVITEMAQGIIFARPSLRNPLSLSHAAQGLSLLTQVFRKWQ